MNEKEPINNSIYEVESDDFYNEDVHLGHLHRGMEI